MTYSQADHDANERDLRRIRRLSRAVADRLPPADSPPSAGPLFGFSTDRGVSQLEDDAGATAQALRLFDSGPPSQVKNSAAAPYLDGRRLLIHSSKWATHLMLDALAGGETLGRLSDFVASWEDFPKARAVLVFNHEPEQSPETGGRWPLETWLAFQELAHSLIADAQHEALDFATVHVAWNAASRVPGFLAGMKARDLGGLFLGDPYDWDGDKTPESVLERWARLIDGQRAGIGETATQHRDELDQAAWVAGMGEAAALFGFEVVCYFDHLRPKEGNDWRLLPMAAEELGRLMAG